MPVILRSRMLIVLVVTVFAGLLGVTILILRGSLLCEYVNSSYASCDPVLRGVDFLEGRASFEASVSYKGQDTIVVGYYFTNLTRERRTFEWSRVKSLTDTGQWFRCGGDDSTLRYLAPPHHRVGPLDVCHLPATTKRALIHYDGELLATLEL